MTTLQDRLPVDAITERASRVTVQRAVQLLFAAIGTAIGWITGRSVYTIGWIAGTAWHAGTFFVSAVIIGFLDGARIPPPVPGPPVPPTGG
jgi:hypothetical protein